MTEDQGSVWQQFVQTGQADINSVRPLVLNSWRTCKELGLNPYAQKVNDILTKDELEQRRSVYKDLISVSVPVMRNLSQLVEDSGFIIAFADADGYLLEIIGDDDAQNSHKSDNFIIGANWSEKSVGTNAIGLSLQKDFPVQVLSYEHFSRCFHRWTCSAAPIHDAQGKILGVLDARASYDKVHSYTLGMVVAAAKAIENELFLRQVQANYTIAENSKKVIFESIAEGIMIFGLDGYLTHINEVAAKILCWEKSYVIGKKIKQIWADNTSPLVHIVLEMKEVTDYEVELFIKEKCECYCVTSRLLVGQDKILEGLLIVINEITKSGRQAQRMHGTEAKLTFNDLIGQNKKLLASVHLGQVAAKSNSHVLLLGESGTGKDVLAQAIHNESNRRNGPFIALNCGAIPRELMASELFGYADGAFTGAKRGGNPGKFELADGGTIFLDEIGETPLELQTLLLRVLEKKTLTRIGGQEVIPINVRIIAATNRDLSVEVKKGTFRKDLFYRLNVISIELIPLKERKDDILALAEHFIKKECVGNLINLYYVFLLMSKNCSWNIPGPEMFANYKMCLNGLLISLRIM